MGGCTPGTPQNPQKWGKNLRFKRKQGFFGGARPGGTPGNFGGREFSESCQNLVIFLSLKIKESYSKLLILSKKCRKISENSGIFPGGKISAKIGRLNGNLGGKFRDLRDFPDLPSAEKNFSENFALDRKFRDFYPFLTQKCIFSNFQKIEKNRKNRDFEKLRKIFARTRNFPRGGIFGEKLRFLNGNPGGARGEISGGSGGKIVIFSTFFQFFKIF